MNEQQKQNLNSLHNQINERLAIIGEALDAYLMMQFVEILNFELAINEELEAQLADAKQVARWESDVASQAITDLEPYMKDAARYQWLRSRTPGSAYRVAGIIYSECGEGVDAGIDAAMQPKE